MKSANRSKILLISPAWVGDIVMSQVLLKHLKQTEPDALIDVLAPEWALELLARMPEVRHAYAMPLGHGQFELKRRWQLGENLRAQGYTRAFVLPNSWKSAIIPCAAYIPQRTGWLGECRWGLLNDVRYLDKKKLPLMIQRFCALALLPNETMPVVLPKPSFSIDPLSVTAVLAKFNLEVTRPILALCPGAEFGPAKRWPANYYAEVAKQKMAEGWDVWLFGAEKDRPLAREIQQQLGEQCQDLTGRTTLGEAIDLLSQTTVVVTNDSGLMHIAAALQRPIVAIYGSSSPHFTPPLSDRVKILSLKLSCSPCFQRICPLGHLNCLRNLKPDSILQAIGDLDVA